jgi:lipopolysaccharide transport system ATP-binding protein
MSNVVIKVENLGKQYRIGKVGTGTISHDLNRWWHKVRGKEDPYLKIGETNDRSKKGNSDLVWALKDISFEVKEGEVLGIIGKNGAGKSTLLKILSRVTGPTVGDIKVKGRIASLLEVGTGFHPELTGRENIFLNGAILGMTKTEIKTKFDQIVDFSGVERYIDTPVKRYSSGMYVRLAFAVAAHLEPEILIIDEVLAVGDAEFQKKCLGKIKDVSGQGRTILFVSHNMAAMKNLCSKGLMLKNGEIEIHNDIEQVIHHYQILNLSKAISLSNIERKGLGNCRIADIKLLNEKWTEKTSFNLGEKIKISLTIEKVVLENLNNIRIVIGIYNLADEGFLRFDTETVNQSFNLSESSSNIVCHINEHFNIKPDLYSLNVAIFQYGILQDYVTGVSRFKIENYDYYGTGKELDNAELSKLFYKHNWEYVR